MLRRLWNDECGALIASEYVVFGTILVIGLIAGAATVRDALATELADFASAISAIDTGFGSSKKYEVKSTEAGSEGPIQTPLSP